MTSTIVMGLKKNQPSTSPPPLQVSNHNPLTGNDIDVTNITPKSSPAQISTTVSGRLVKRSRKYFGATWEYIILFMGNFSPSTKFTVD